MPHSFVVRFRGLFAFLVACSLILTHLAMPASKSACVDCAWAVASAAADGGDESFRGTDSLDEHVAEEASGEAYSGDYPHEADKLLSLFALHWGSQGASWSDAYFVALHPDPVFSFERPPKSFAL